MHIFPKIGLAENNMDCVVICVAALKLSTGTGGLKQNIRSSKTSDVLAVNSSLSEAMPAPGRQGCYGGGICNAVLLYLTKPGIGLQSCRNFYTGSGLMVF